jgi:hypothetical protein
MTASVDSNVSNSYRTGISILEMTSNNNSDF